MNDKSKPERSSENSLDKPSVRLAGTVEKIIPAVAAVEEPEKVQISIEGADHLYREIRLENALEDETGKTVRLKPGAHVEVTIEAEPLATKPPSQNSGR
jgi:hypothetical protein